MYMRLTTYECIYTTLCTLGSYCMRETQPISIPAAITRGVLVPAFFAAFRTLPARNRKVLLGAAFVIVGLSMLAKAR
jgi:uncharacterized BrkB/YihY/UPF0761 family membrane protein